MTAADPRPALAAALAARLAPAAEALAAAYADDGSQDTPEFRAWDECQRRRTHASIARCLERAGTPSHDKT